MSEMRGISATAEGLASEAVRTSVFEQSVGRIYDALVNASYLGKSPRELELTDQHINALLNSRSKTVRFFLDHVLAWDPDFPANTWTRRDMLLDAQAYLWLAEEYVDNYKADGA